MANRRIQKQAGSTASEERLDPAGRTDDVGRAARAQSDELRQLLGGGNSAGTSSSQMLSDTAQDGMAVQMQTDEGGAEDAPEIDQGAEKGPLPAGIVDRIEGEYAVIEDADTLEFIDVPLASLPPWIKEGDRFDGKFSGPAKIPKGIIDRIEGEYAVIEDADTLEFVDVPVTWLPSGVKEGDRLDGKLVGPGRLPKGIIDRIEGEYAVIEDAISLEFVDVPVAWLPYGVKEGDRLDGKLVGPGKIPVGIIDRIEGEYAVIEDAISLEFVDVPVAWLPEGVKEGDHVSGGRATAPEQGETTDEAP